MSELRNISFLQDEWDFIRDHKLDILKEIKGRRCLKTKKVWNENPRSVIIACITKPYPKVIWWYKNPKYHGDIKK
jgi:hypothetical protein